MFDLRVWCQTASSCLALGRNSNHVFFLWLLPEVIISAKSAKGYMDLCRHFGKLGLICNETEIHRIFGSSLQKFLTAPWANWLQQVPAGLPVLRPPFHRHLQSQFGEMFNSTCKSQLPVVVSENQAPAHPFTLENFPHKF